MPYCFPRSSIKFQGHTGQNITDFDPNWAFPDYRPVAAFKSQICLVVKMFENLDFAQNFRKLSILVKKKKKKKKEKIYFNRNFRNSRIWSEFLEKI